MPILFADFLEFAFNNIVSTEQKSNSQRKGISSDQFNLALLKWVNDNQDITDATTKLEHFAQLVRLSELLGLAHCTEADKDSFDKMMREKVRTLLNDDLHTVFLPFDSNKFSMADEQELVELWKETVSSVFDALYVCDMWKKLDTEAKKKYIYREKIGQEDDLINEIVSQRFCSEERYYRLRSFFARQEIIVRNNEKLSNDFPDDKAYQSVKAIELNDQTWDLLQVCPITDISMLFPSRTEVNKRFIEQIRLLALEMYYSALTPAVVDHLRERNQSLLQMLENAIEKPTNPFLLLLFNKMKRLLQTNIELFTVRNQPIYYVAPFQIKKVTEFYIFMANLDQLIKMTERLSDPNGYLHLSNIVHIFNSMKHQLDCMHVKVSRETENQKMINTVRVAFEEILNRVYAIIDPILSAQALDQRNLTPLLEALRKFQSQCTIEFTTSLKRDSISIDSINDEEQQAPKMPVPVDPKISLPAAFARGDSYNNPEKLEELSLGDFIQAIKEEKLDVATAIANFTKHRTVSQFQQFVHYCEFLKMADLLLPHAQRENLTLENIELVMWENFVQLLVEVNSGVLLIQVHDDPLTLECKAEPVQLDVLVLHHLRQGATYLDSLVVYKGSQGQQHFMPAITPALLDDINFSAICTLSNVIMNEVQSLISSKIQMVDEGTH